MVAEVKMIVVATVMVPVAVATGVQTAAARGPQTPRHRTRTWDARHRTHRRTRCCKIAERVDRIQLACLALCHHRSRFLSHLHSACGRKFPGIHRLLPLQQLWSGRRSGERKCASYTGRPQSPT